MGGTETGVSFVGLTPRARGTISVMCVSGPKTRMGTPRDSPEEAVSSESPIERKKHTKKPHGLQAFLPVWATTTNIYLDLQGRVKDKSRGWDRKVARLTPCAIKPALTASSALIIPLKVAATFVKLAMPPPMIRILPSGRGGGRVIRSTGRK